MVFDSASFVGRGDERRGKKRIVGERERER